MTVTSVSKRAGTSAAPSASATATGSDAGAASVARESGLQPAAGHVRSTRLSSRRTRQRPGAVGSGAMPRWPYPGGSAQLLPTFGPVLDGVRARDEFADTAPVVASVSRRGGFLPLGKRFDRGGGR